MEQLYQKVLKTHYLHPVGLNRKINASHHAEGYNASCGDEIDMFLQITAAHSAVLDIAFETDSCAICTASASILCQLSKGKNLPLLKTYYQYLSEKLKNEPLTLEKPVEKSLNDLLEVRHYPSRINCVLLPWQTAIKAACSTKKIKQQEKT